MTDNTPGFEDVLAFWFGEQDARGLSGPDASARWWKKDPAFDAEIGERFGPLLEAIRRGERDAWLDQPRSRLAYVIVCDQLTRNMFRDAAGMFASDELARAAVLDGLVRGFDQQLAGHCRVFFYMPLMHSEQLEHQDRCVELFTVMRDGADDPELRERVGQNVDFAIKHREIVARFGRFPHRNAILGRSSSAEELAFLEQPGSSF